MFLPVCYFAFATVCSYLTYSGTMTLFAYHPFLMIYAICFCVPTALWCEKKKFPSKHWFHMGFQILAAILMAVGYLVIWQNKELFKRAHLQTWHSWIGAAVFFCFVIQCVGASFQLFPGKSPKDRAKHVDLHKSSGSLLFLLSVVALFYGWFSMGAFKEDYWRSANLFFGGGWLFVFVSLMLKK
eukprot:TRINITY_DN762_c0_g1_i2.p1 TRINITY_DN762_c0_g1~~TRINITY_DN762_c0_g1_i2.p1  ORF type:complete len:184 (-),score=34.92 TRINITY_DN762_c0_g1_i2:61-612(-)